MKGIARRAAIAIAVAIAVAPGMASATVGYFQHGYGIKAKGMGGVGIALPQDAVAPASNPAGIAFTGNRIDVGIDFFRPIRGSEIVGNGAGLTGSNDGSGNKVYELPSFGWTHALRPNLVFGVAVYGNGGMNTTYNRSPFTAFGGRSPAGVDLSQLFVAPTLAWKINDRHAVGVSLNYAYQKFRAYGLQPFAALSSDAANLSDRGTDDASGWGVHVGWTGRVTDRVTLGATYQTKTRMDPFGKYRGLFAEGGDFDIPENYGVGIAFAATPKLTIAADVLRINYGDVKSVGTPADCLFAGTCMLGQAGGGGFGWRNSTVYKIGASYAVSKALTLRAGYATLRQPIPASQTFFNVLAPGVVEDHFTLGLTWALSGATEVSLSYMHANRKHVNGAGSIPVAFGGGNANLRMYQDALGVSIGWKQ